MRELVFRKTIEKNWDMNLERILNMRDTGENRELLIEIRNQTQLSET